MHHKTEFHPEAPIKECLNVLSVLSAANKVDVLIGVKGGLGYSPGCVGVEGH